jgi:hypothetical protein
MSYKTSLFITIIKTSLLNSLLISLRYKFIKGVFYIKTNIFINKSFKLKVKFYKRVFKVNQFIKELYIISFAFYN